MEKSFDLSAVLDRNKRKHKCKPMQSVAQGIKKRLESNIKNRKSTRCTVFDSGRDLVSSGDIETKITLRRKQLEKWKAEKELLKKELATQKKKPFVAGVFHAPLKYIPPPSPKVIPSTTRVTRSQTRKQNVKQRNVEASTLSRDYTKSFAPNNATFRPQIKLAEMPTLVPISKKINSKKNSTIMFSPVLPNQKPVTSRLKVTASKTRAESRLKLNTNEMKTTRGKFAKSPNSKIKVFTSQISSSSESEEKVVKEIREENNSDSNSLQNSIMKTPNLRKSPKKRKSLKKSDKKIAKNIPKSESSFEEKLRSPTSVPELKTPEQITDQFEHISPYVTLSRGKDRARKEMMEKINLGLLEEDTSDVEDVKHFRQQLNSEITRMTEICETWDKISEHTILSESVQGLVLSATGKARLLMSKKMQQFASLIDQCEHPDPGTALITPSDLHGFWDMVFIQVIKVDKEFKELENLKAQGWVEKQAVHRQHKKQPTQQPPTSNTSQQENVKFLTHGQRETAAHTETVAKPAVRGPSKLREMIAAARKAKKQQESNVSTPNKTVESKTFEAGFFSVTSPVRSPGAAITTPTNKHSLLMTALSNNAKASASKNCVSHAMLRASMTKNTLDKNFEIEGIAPLVQTPKSNSVNLDATPPKSILKSAKKSTRRSNKTVLFNESDRDLQDVVTTPMKTDTDLAKRISPMDIETDENKENYQRNYRITRNQAKSRKSSVENIIETPTGDPVKKRSTRKKVLQGVDDNEFKQTPRRSSRRIRNSILSNEVVN